MNDGALSQSRCKSDCEQAKVVALKPLPVIPLYSILFTHNTDDTLLYFHWFHYYAFTDIDTAIVT